MSSPIPEHPSSGARAGWQHAVRALRHRAYRRFFLAQSASLIGTWVQLVGVSWLVWRLTHDAAWLGWTGFAAQIPILLIAPFAGVWSDRFDRRRLLLVTQALSLLQSLGLALLVLTGTVEAWHCLVLAGLLGCINAFDTPVRQSFTVAMVADRADLPSAIALNSFMFNLARLLGPSVAGFLISAFGEAACFLLNGASYVGVLSVLATLRLPPPPRRAASGSVVTALLEGARFAWHHALIGPLLFQLMLVSALIAPYVQLMPIFAGQVFGGDARTLGLLIGAAGAGAVGATVMLATRPGIHGLPRVIGRGGLLAGLGLAGFAQSTVLPLSMTLMVAVGFGIISTAASVNTLIQSRVPDDKRGRIMSLYTISFLGLSPLGSLTLGHLSAAFGAPRVLAVAGLLCALGSLRFLLRASALTRTLVQTGAQKELD